MNAHTQPPHLRIYTDLEQGSEQWMQARCGLLTASEMHLIVTPTLKPASNEKERGHLFELLAQRITGHVEPHYINDDMLRGHEDEIEARNVYAARFAPVDEVGFMVNTKLGFPIGYSPDGLVGDDGLIECKSRRQKFQVQTIVNATVPAEHVIQCQTALLVSERQWLDFISYSGGLPMVTIRVLPDPEMQAAIIEAATAFETRLADKLATYRANIDALGCIPTERKIIQELF